MKKVNVLITAASRRVPLVRAFRDVVERLGKGRVITTDINPLSPALYFGHRHHIVPLTTDRHYVPIIESLCDAEDVTLIIPTIDDELPIFGRHKRRLEQLGVWVAVSDEETSTICNDKYLTYLFCRKYGIATPETRLAGDVNLQEIRYPAFVKPRVGRGSIGVHLVNNPDELRFFSRYVSDAIVQDYLAGTEYTVDLLADFDGRVISVVPRERLIIRAGVSDKGVTRKNKDIIEFATHLARCLKISGPANIQVKQDGHDIQLVEVNPRFSGGIPLTIAAGANFPEWLVQLRSGLAVPPQIGKFRTGLTMMSFEESIFAPEHELLSRHDQPPRQLAKSRHATALVN